MARHHFTLLVIMVTSTLPSTSSERNTVIHHVRTILAVHHFTMLVAMVTSTLPSTSSERNTVIHHVRTIYHSNTPLDFGVRHWCTSHDGLQCSSLMRYWAMLRLPWITSIVKWCISHYCFSMMGHSVVLMSYWAIFHHLATSIVPWCRLAIMHAGLQCSSLHEVLAMLSVHTLLHSKLKRRLATIVSSPNTQLGGQSRAMTDETYLLNLTLSLIGSWLWYAECSQLARPRACSRS